MMEIINIIGNALANELHISPPACRGLIKLSFKDEYGPFKQISAHLLENVIRNSLKNRLEKLEIPPEKVNAIILTLSEILMENQSLIPFSV
ncbi:MAG: hypothetical protein ACFFCV_05730 [Promethearchaeota archaeon]